MTAQWIDGREIAKAIRLGVREEISTLSRKPALAVVMVGENPASVVYVRNKIKACQEVGITSIERKLPQDTTQACLLETIRELNEDNNIDGILVQLPLPAHLNAKAVLEAIDPNKDVDGFHIFNTGKLFTTGEGFKPCTPAGIIELLKATGTEMTGRHAVILGRSNIVGKPMAMLLLQENATVTITHSRTQDLAAHTRQADILVAAIGRAKFVTADMVKPGAVVIDVGMNRDENGKLCGDVDTEAVRNVASWITPVPGGVGPMTIAMLMVNTLTSAKSRQ